MAELILGKKLGMTQIFLSDGKVVPVTVIQAGPCPIVQVKTPEKDGYSAVQIGFEAVRKSKVRLPQLGHFERAKVAPTRILREFRITATDQYKIGETLTVERFAAGEIVDVIGVTRGRGFAGVIKRHHMHGAPGSHGTHEFFRHGGSIGCHTWPGRVWKNKRMAGHLGNTRVTVRNLQVVQIDPERNVILLRGAVPGAGGGFVAIRKTAAGRK